MSFSIGLTENDLKNEVGQSTFITHSGIYDVNILAIVEDTNDSGGLSLGFFVEYNSNKQMLYGALPLTTYDGKASMDSNKKLFGGLCKIANVDIEQTFESETVDLPIGKEGTDKEVKVLVDFEEIPVKLWVRCEYYKNKDGEIRENKIIKGFFHPTTNATAAELINNETNGAYYAKLEEKNAFSESKYNKVTAEEVQAWRDSFSKNTKTATTEPVVKKSRFAK